ncbi:hypothetical protein KUTeg_006716 [Tegillarca granosa]|uniref:Uncharacterized protein n=1 Tax=Tegillarca granosa TaxID=220873 RepID=A0ABQ9FD50_TEGGR|nr:hypothetical protein KUTeg_006716 [Tegillarca granosa]
MRRDILFIHTESASTVMERYGQQLLPWKQNSGCFPALDQTNDPSLRAGNMKFNFDNSMPENVLVQDDFRYTGYL